MTHDLLTTCFIEGQPYSSELLLDLGLTQRAIDLYTYLKDKRLTFRFCGFLSSNDKLFTVLPKEQVKPQTDRELASMACLLAKTFQLYAQENDLDEAELDLLGKSGGTKSNAIAVALALLNDYNKNGLLIRDSVTEKKSGQGKINWPRTINRHLPVFDSETAFYFETVTRNRSQNAKDLIVQLHRFAVQRCRKLYGWILSTEFEPEKTLVPSMPCSIPRALHILRNELYNCFRDRDITIINLLIGFFNNEAESADETTIQAYGTKKFYHVWEAVCRSLFKHEKALMSLIPKPQWVRISDGKESTQQTKQLPDILYHNENICYVLDAKYYTHSNNLPGWRDMVKQFYYAGTIRSDSFESVQNAMIFPGSHESLFSYIGYAKIENKENVIQAFSLNLWDALQSYTSFSKNRYREKLTEIWP